jgi:hypothetical protein
MMNWTHYSKFLVVVVVLAAVAPGVAALSVDGDSPDATEAGENIDKTVTITNLHQDPEVSTWTLETGTELESPQWTITYLDQAGDEIKKTSGEGANVTSDELSTENNIAALEVRVRGTVPEPESFTYPEEETVTVMSLVQAPENGVTSEFTTIEVHAFTEESKTARENLDAARNAIDTADEQGADVSDENSTFDSAVSSYENGNLENANRLAQQAKDNAESKVQSSQQTQTILYAVGGLVVLLVLGGGAYWYRSQQDSYDKLG